MAKSFELIYQAVGSKSGLSVVATAYDDAKAIVSDESGDMVEIGATGKYYKDFSIAAANWSVQVADSEGGKAVKAFGKEVFDVAGIDSQVSTVDGKVVAVHTAVDLAYVKTVATLTAVNTIDVKVVAVQTAVDAVSSKLDNIVAPAMIG